MYTLPAPFVKSQGGKEKEAGRAGTLLPAFLKRRFRVGAGACDGRPDFFIEYSLDFVSE
jgi:hypothetical protein